MGVDRFDGLRCVSLRPVRPGDVGPCLHGAHDRVQVQKVDGPACLCIAVDAGGHLLRTGNCHCHPNPPSETALVCEKICSAAERSTF
eukprot:11500141-Karenia_brevis.AAC.1